MTISARRALALALALAVVLGLMTLTGLRLISPPSALGACRPFSVHGSTFQVTSVHHISCARANAVLRKWQRSGRVPHGWGCGLSAKACAKGSRSFTFRYH